jgi:hypothetical protein
MELLRQSFDIERGPPIRLQLLRLGEQDHALLIKLHHLVTDGWSQRLFWEELEALYSAKTKGLPAGLPDLPVQYRHFVERSARGCERRAEEQLNYGARLEGLTELPLGRTGPVRRRGPGAAPGFR